MANLDRGLRRLVKSSLQCRSQSLSQAGQDLWVYGEVFNEKRAGFFLDIGAHDGIHISNTYLLERRYDWAGICVEANPETFKVLEKNRRVNCVNICLDSEERVVEFASRGVTGGIISPGLDNQARSSGASTLVLQTRRLVDVLQEHSAPQEIDYLSIDVEGAEERILSAFDFEKYRFNCITIERPSIATRELLSRYGYVLVKEIVDLDCFYVHSDFLLEYRSNLKKYYKKRRLALRWR